MITLRPKQKRDKMLSIRLSENELDRLELTALKKYEYTASFCRKLLLGHLEAETIKEGN